MGSSNCIPIKGEVEKMARTLFGRDVHHEIFLHRRNHGSWVGLVISISHLLNPSHRKIHRLDVPRLRRIYNEWGPSTRDCLNLSRHRSAEVLHGAEVIQAAKDFIKSAPTTSRVNMVTASHILFKMEPEGVTEELRQISIWSIATDRIKDIILYAAAEADAQVRIKFYQTISKHPRLKTFVGQMFEDIVLAWFYSHSNGHMPCVAAQGTYSLQIPACGEDHTVFFGNNIAAMQTNVLAKTLPLLLLPLSPSFADAIVLTEKFIITIQATIAYRHSVDPRGFAIIEEYLPRTTKRSKEWCHVFITNDENGAAFLRSQFLSNLPSHIQIYSAVFDVGTPGILPSILRKHVEGFNDRRVSMSRRLQLLVLMITRNANFATNAITQIWRLSS